MKEEKAYFNFLVEDTGEGMSEEMQTRLFQPFEQESATTAQKHGGSGLGLSIAKNFVELMSGSISVKSKKERELHLLCLFHLNLNRLQNRK